MVLRLILLSAIISLALFVSNTMAVEEPAFKTVLREGGFEIRDYPPLVVAEVTVTCGQQEAASKGFRLLAGYIFGGNKRRQSIAMTTPVVQERSSERIAMTVPVTQIERAGSWIVRFTMPRAYTLEALPEPDDTKVHLRLLLAERFAVIPFSGLAGKESVDAKISELLAAVKAHHLRTIGPVSLVQYNPPWTSGS